MSTVNFYHKKTQEQQEKVNITVSSLCEKLICLKLLICNLLTCIVSFTHCIFYCSSFMPLRGFCNRRLTNFFITIVIISYWVISIEYKKYLLKNWGSAWWGNSIYLVYGNTMCVSTCQVEFVLTELSFFILLPGSRFIWCLGDFSVLKGTVLLFN